MEHCCVLDLDQWQGLRLASACGLPAGNVGNLWESGLLTSDWGHYRPRHLVAWQVDVVQAGKVGSTEAPRVEGERHSITSFPAISAEG